jgi:hypothetical protein
MNPFVDPKKRSITLPAGCKDLADVLQLQERGDTDPVKAFIHLLLMDAQQQHASAVTIGARPEHGQYTPFCYKVGNILRGSAFSSDFRSLIVAELERMAGLAESPFPKDGIFSVCIENTHFKWRVQMMSLDAACTLTRMED